LETKMSNELSVILKNNPALAVPTGLDEDTLAVAGSSINQVKRISIEGGVFRKMAGGKEVAAIEDRHMNVIFVKMAHAPSRSFYSQGYQKGVKISPICWSNDSRVPDAEVKQKQAESCDKCPHSVKGSGTNGMGSACRLSWRTAVVLPNDTSGDVMQLNIPAASCFGSGDNGVYPFRAYVQMLANNNVSAGRIITKMQFDLKSSAPKLLFSPAAAVDTDDYETIQSQGKSQAAERAVKLTVYQVDSEGEEADNEAFEQPKTPVVQSAAPEESDIEEPTVRSTATQEPVIEKAATDVLKKWGKKG
jgi:hypothetical protein